MNGRSFIPFTSVTLHDGFWEKRYNLNKNVSLSQRNLRFSRCGKERKIH